MRKLTCVAAIALAVLACGSSDNTDSGTASGSNGAGASGSTNAGGASQGAGAQSSVGQGGAGQGGSGAQGGAGMVSDPNADGPHAIMELDDMAAVPGGGTVDVHAAYPTSGGPYPVVLFAHGFLLPPSQYFAYVRRLATFGYVALTVDFQAGFTNTNHMRNAQELLAGLDWASQALPGVADSEQAGATGHSLGGKLSLLAATLDPRIRATITLDPVDGSMGCSPQDCPDVSSLLPISVPTGFIGETLDASGGFQPCAPAADNFETFYANAGAPSLSVEVLGANHMSFLDDISSCGLPCTFCNQPTADPTAVHALSQAFVVAFYERHLKGNTGYDTYLTGAEAQARYVDSGMAAIAWK